MTTPLDVVLQHYPLPFPLYPRQVTTVNELAPLPRAGYYMEVGTGKTVVSTVSALFRKITLGRSWFVLVPPILIPMWCRWLANFDVVVTRYEGTPKKRAKIPLKGDFIVMSMPIFKQDFDRIIEETYDDNVGLLVDEATSIKNPGSQNHRAMKIFNDIHEDLMFLTGTPLSTPLDGYGYISVLAPKIYRNMRHFENMHIAAKDFNDTVVEWNNLDILKSNMTVNAVRVLQREMLAELPHENYIPIHYDLEPIHTSLYEMIAEEQLLPFATGESAVDTLTPSKLAHALQQLIVNLSYYADDVELRPAVFDLIDEVLEEIGVEGELGSERPKKLIIFAYYQRSIETLTKYLEPHGVVCVYGKQSPKQKEAALNAFIHGDARVAVLQTLAAGQGLDGLQHVCNEMLFVEHPNIPKDFHQAVGRLVRGGQKLPVNVRIAVANHTCQVRLHRNMMIKDVLVNYVQRGFKDLVDAIYGDTGVQPKWLRKVKQAVSV